MNISGASPGAREDPADVQHNKEVVRMPYTTNFLSLTSRVIPQQTTFTLLKSIEKIAFAHACCMKKASPPPLELDAADGSLFEKRADYSRLF